MGVNRVTLLGNLGADPEMREVNGVVCCNAKIATEARTYDHRTDSHRQMLTWHRAFFFAKLGEQASVSLKKGVGVYIEGHLSPRVWVNKAGVKNYACDVIVSSFQIVSGRRLYEPDDEDDPHEAMKRDRLS